MKNGLSEKLSSGDLRSIGNADLAAAEVHDQNDFDDLFKCLYSNDRLIVMRAADAVEKVTVKRSDLLMKHKEEIIAFCGQAGNIEFKWHLALLLPRLPLSENEFAAVWRILSSWLLDPNESKIVRTNSMQALFELSKQDPAVREEFESILSEVEKENIPSLQSRIRKIRR